MERITNKQIEIKIDYLNQITGNPAKPYETINGKFTHQAGNYHQYNAYGGVSLDQMCEGGGTRRISTDGFGTKRELFNFLSAFISGIELH